MSGVLGVPFATMMGIRDYARRHPVGVFFLLAYVISWIGSLLTGGPLFLRGESVELDGLLAMGLSILAGPFVAGLAMTYFVRGRAGLQDLVSRMTKWRVGGRWYAPLLIFPVLLLTVSLALSAGISAEMRPIFFAPGIVMGLMAGLIEEVGWMGFAYPTMRSKRNILQVSIYLGFLHALWHLLPSFLGSYNDLGSYWLPYFLGSFVFIMALRVLIIWVYENTESLLLTQLMHASSTGFFAILISTDIAPVNWVIFYWVYAVVLSAAAALVVATHSRHLVRQRQSVEGK